MRKPKKSSILFREFLTLFSAIIRKHKDSPQMGLSEKEEKEKKERKEKIMIIPEQEFFEE